ncbi:Gfo/Idh/MocA family oxidoreductase [Kitasatospora sp. MAP5-34]|uniref:Gfo/Idh/MocA family protein n=1 Tax=Kitasatospora sp. MAP5-34 TaxID=3035102 RepID=UPI002475B6BF|nr:Gfo/Idh/MocA family oxidoreductase [Kitasatospora sp. MAP5-34]MDH6578639.1 putative dehydrogenase [Kitasatospora sp. MAP5-34]
MTRPIRVVLIGAGTRARKLYAPWLAGAAPFTAIRATPVAVVDSDLDAARSIASDLPGAAVAHSSDVDRILADTRPDLVVVASPDATHRDHVVRSLAANCTTFVEKPLATTVRDAFDLVAKADRASAKLLVGHNLRFTNVHAAICEWLTQGRIGAVVDAELHYTLKPSHARSYFTRWHRTRAASGGLEVTKSCHHLDLLAWWLDSRPVSVQAVLKRDHYLPGLDSIPIDADIHDGIRADIQYESGATARYSLTADAPREGYRCTLRGTSGSCVIDYDTSDGPHSVRFDSDQGGRVVHRLDREHGTHAGADARMLSALVETVADGGRRDFATAVDAALAVATGVSMYEASERGQRLSIPHPVSHGAAE